MLQYCAVYFALFLAGDLGSSIAFDMLFQILHLPSMLNFLLRALENLILTYALFDWCTVKCLHLSMADFRITAALKKWGVVIACILPAAVVLVFAAVGSVTVRWDGAAQTALTVLASAVMAFRAGLLEEMLFRGYIMRLLEWRWNRSVAVLLPAVLFSLVHIPSMEYFSVSGIVLLLISGTLAAVMFSLMTYRGNSISNSVLLHMLWNFMLVTDLCHITTADGAYGKPLLSIIIPARQPLLTGAGFGVEASAIAIAGYLAVVCWLILSEKRGGSAD